MVIPASSELVIREADAIGSPIDQQNYVNVRWVTVRKHPTIEGANPLRQPTC